MSLTPSPSRHLRALLLLVLLLGLTACGPKVVRVQDPASDLPPTVFTTKVHHWPKKDSKKFDFLDVYDPWESLNRKTYEVNSVLDTYVMLPATHVYTTVLPSPVRTGMDNLLMNLGEVPTFFNCLLQLKMEKAAVTFSRLLINSTFGVGGVMDLASNNKSLHRQDEDMGQTLGYWGVGDGPYFVLPLMGPSNLRDTVGFGGDVLVLYFEMKYVYDVLGIDSTPLDLAKLIVRALNLRAKTSFRYHSTGSPFEYELVRFIYTKKRELDISR